MATATMAGALGAEAQAFAECVFLRMEILFVKQKTALAAKAMEHVNIVKAKQDVPINRRRT